MLGGAWVPAFLFPDWLQRATLVVPTRWAVDGLDAMTWRGLPLQAAFLPVAVLLGWSALFALIALWRFDWEKD
jgi:ABC-2 type transport system permease protein